MNHVVIIIICLLGMFVAFYVINTYAIQNLPVEMIIIEGGGGDALEVELPRIISAFDPNSTLKDPKATNKLSSGVAIIANLGVLIGGTTFSICLAKGIIAILETLGAFSFKARRRWLQFSHSWIKNYGLCRAGSYELLENYDELLRIVSRGVSEEYSNPSILLTFNGTVTDLITRYNDSPILRGIFRHWRRLKEENNITVQRFFAPAPHKWALIDNELEALSLTIYERITGSIETLWSHSQDERVKHHIKNAQKLFPDLDFALFKGKIIIKESGEDKEVNAASCVGYIKGNLVYTLQSSDIKEHKTFYDKLIACSVKSHEEVIREANSTRVGFLIIAFDKLKKTLVGKRLQKNKEDLLAKLKTLLQKIETGEIAV